MTFHSSFSSFPSPKCESLALHPSFSSLGDLAPFFSHPPSPSFFQCLVQSQGTGSVCLGPPSAQVFGGSCQNARSALKSRRVSNFWAKSRASLHTLFHNARQNLRNSPSWSPSPPLSYHALILFTPSSPHS